MKNEQKKKIYQAALYLRLSNEKLNENIGQSDSIANQEALLRSFAEEQSDIQIYHIYKEM